MSEIFREIEQELKRERWLALWRRWQREVIAGAGALILLGAGLGFWFYYGARQAEHASSAFDTALALRGDSALAAFHALAEQGGNYGALAAFHEAAALANNQRRKRAIAIYDDLSARIVLPLALRDLARLNAALLLIGRAPLAEIEDRLRRAAGDQAILRYSAREIIALAALAENNIARARELLAPMLDDPNVPPTLAARAQIMLDSLPPQK